MAAGKYEVLDFNTNSSIIAVLISVIEELDKKRDKNGIMLGKESSITPTSRILESKQIHSCVPIKPSTCNSIEIIENRTPATPRKNGLFSFDENESLTQSNRFKCSNQPELKLKSNTQPIIKVKEKSTLDIKESPIYKALNKQSSSISSAFTSLIESKFPNINQNKITQGNESDRIEKKDDNPSMITEKEKSSKPISSSIKDKFEFFRKNKEKRLLSIFQYPTDAKRKKISLNEFSLNSEE